jgi:hypothetical protein
MSKEGQPETIENATAEVQTDGRMYTKEEVENRIRGIVSQVTERDQKLAEVQAELARIAAEREAKERDELQQKEEWKTLLEKETAKFAEERTTLQAQLDQIKAQAESDRIDRQLEQSGLNDPIVRAGVKVNLSNATNEDGTPKAIDAFLAELRESSPHLFGGLKHGVSVGNAAAGVSAARSGLTPEVADQWLKSGDPEKTKIAKEYWKNYYSQKKQ